MVKLVTCSIRNIADESSNCLGLSGYTHTKSGWCFNWSKDRQICSPWNVELDKNWSQLMVNTRALVLHNPSIKHNVKLWENSRIRTLERRMEWIEKINHLVPKRVRKASHWWLHFWWACLFSQHICPYQHMYSFLPTNFHFYMSIEWVSFSWTCLKVGEICQFQCMLNMKPFSSPSFLFLFSFLHFYIILSVVYLHQWFTSLELFSQLLNIWMSRTHSREINISGWQGSGISIILKAPQVILKYIQF